MPVGAGPFESAMLLQMWPVDVPQSADREVTLLGSAKPVVEVDLSDQYVAIQAPAGAATEAPMGLLPAQGSIDTTGLALDGRTMEELLSVSKDDWRREAEGIAEFFGKFDGRLPAEMERQRQGLVKRLG